MRNPLETLADLTAPYDCVLARAWTMGPGDLCPTCPMRSECHDQTRCLHLAASAGTNTRVDGPFRRFPIGARQVGRVVLERSAFVARRDLASLGLAEAAWLAMHDVRCFVALPLLHDDACRGVIALFSRRDLAEADLRGLAAASELLARALAPGEGSSARIPRPPANAPQTLAAIERAAIERTLEITRGRVSGPRGAATILGLKPTTLQSRMRKLGVRRPSRA
jgi:hypothetical protein